jgi:hypothetical protein
LYITFNKRLLNHFRFFHRINTKNWMLEFICNFCFPNFKFIFKNLKYQEDLRIIRRHFFKSPQPGHSILEYYPSHKLICLSYYINKGFYRPGTSASSFISIYNSVLRRLAPTQDIVFIMRVVAYKSNFFIEFF